MIPLVKVFCKITIFGSCSNHGAKLDGNQNHVLHAWRNYKSFRREKKSVFECSRFNQTPLTDQIISELPSNISSTVPTRMLSRL